MHKPAFKKRNVELILVWIIPSFFLLISFLYWYSQGKLAYFCYLYTLPMVYTIIFVNIATDHFNLWRWQVTFFPKLRLLYRPLVCTIYFNLSFVLGAHLLTAPTTVTTLLESFLVIGFIGMMIGVLFDLFTLDVGFIWVARPQFNLEKYGTIVVLTRYAFYFFGAIGAAAGSAAKVGHYYLYELPSAPMHWLPLGVLAGVAISPPFLVWAYLFDSRSIPISTTSFSTPYSLEPLDTQEESEDRSHPQIPEVSAGI